MSRHPKVAAHAIKETILIMKKRNIIALIATMMCLWADAQSFGDMFRDETLRVNFTLAGNATEQGIYINNMNRMEKWHGRRKHLDEFPVEGNAQFELKDHKTGKVIYRNSLSTLFQEWQTYPEAKTTNRAFENVALMPMPKDSADLTISLFNNRRQTVESVTETIAPDDILTRRIGDEVTPYDVLLKADDTSSCINIAFLAEGYTEAEMDKFIADAQTATDAIFSHEPFKTYKGRFNVIAVKSPSEESGTSVPSKGVWKKTALGSNFDTFYSERYLTTLNLNKVHDWLAGTPYEHIIILVNTDVYGGGGILNFYNLGSTGHKYYKPVIVHEFGHSFAGLADEYAYESEALEMYPTDVEPWEANITTLANFKGKWESLIKKGTPTPTPLSKDPKTIQTRVGLFQGAGYNTKKIYRGVQDCRMRTNTNPDFCIVCRHALEKLIKFYTE